MGKNAWVAGSQSISKLMRKDLIRLYRSDPVQDSIGEVYDDLVPLGTYKANVTTPPESIDEDVAGTLRTHFYEITLDPNVFIPPESKIFIELVQVRQGRQGAMLEVTDLQGGLLGQTLSAADEEY